MAVATVERAAASRGRFAAVAAIVQATNGHGPELSQGIGVAPKPKQVQGRQDGKRRTSHKEDRGDRRADDNERQVEQPHRVEPADHPPEQEHGRQPHAAGR